MVTYFVLASLATVYPAVLYATKKRHHFKRVSQCCRSTIGGFLETSLIFSVSMLVAAVYRYGSAISRTSIKTENQSVYALLYSFALSTLSVFPPIMLQALADDDHNRKPLRLFLWFFVITLVIPITVLFYLVWYAGIGALVGKATISNQLWVNNCDEVDTGWGIWYMMAFSHALLLLNFPWWAHETSTYIPGVRARFDDWARGFWARRHRALEILTRLNVLACGLMMWALLILVLYNVVVFSRRAGQWDKDQEWSFGQVLSIATFAPVLLELCVAILGMIRSPSVLSHPIGTLWNFSGMKLTCKAVTFYKNKSALQRTIPHSQKLDG